ncbi:hypothetical protein C475_09669 [Halosimplex carlsbadense 2-9-1]|uniref:Uncharacterized protein n=1 Tax=Halosimplex carlsbadense 2-9-1 TaxID=797114 RepID=M0CTH2_9EURY|nr:hypothetical protein [Halosimplex carlsbadense]ELZ25717.1 hypothetical protein C475_09669 [Halosimplex carlsbadense 2-9-1]
MDTRDTRRELGRSVRLLADEERWLFLGLLAGAGGYLIWLAGTGVAVSQVADLVVGAYAVDPWSTEAAGLAVTFAVLWVLVPSAVAVRYVVGNLTNLRGNVEQCYRFDRPLVALVPPLVLLGVAVAVGAARGAATWDVLALLAVANTLLLVRTVAYGYRVYSFSTPRLLQALVFASAVVATTAIVSRVASLGGQTALVEAAAARYGVSDVVFGEVARAGFTAPLLPLAAVATPAALALAYVWIQLFASLVVRIRRPDVPRSAIRAGQRYPQVVQPGTSDRLAMGTASEAESGSDPGSGSPGGEAQTAGSDGASSGGSTADTASNAGGPATDASESADADEESVEPAGQTRVFSPPEDAEVPGADAGSGGTAVKNEFCPICGETYAAEPDRTNCPNCNAVLDRD